MQRRISVIIPVYNAEKYLERCIESILVQTYTDWEIILVDDGSNDGSSRICDEYAMNYDNIVAFHQSNGGVSVARNTGLQHSSGNYICFVDCDDWISSCMFEYLMKAIIEDESDMAMCRIQITDCYFDDEIIPYSNIKKFTQDSNQYLVDNFLNHGNSCCAKIFQKDTLAGLVFQQGLTIGEDMLFLLKAREKFSKVSVLDFNGYYYLQLATSAMNKEFRPSFMDEIRCWQQALFELKDCDLFTRNKVKSVLIISSFQVLNKLALTEQVYPEFEKKCREVITSNMAGWRYLCSKEKVQFILAFISIRLYKKVYKILV